MSDLVPIKCEARLVGLSKQRRKDGDWTEVRFHIQPDETPHALFILPLGTHCTLAIKGVEDAEKATDATQTPEEPEKVKGGPLSRQAGILCGMPTFCNFLRSRDPSSWDDLVDELGYSSADAAALRVRELCEVKSRAELDHSDDAAISWKELTDAYYETQYGRSLDQMKEARDR